MTAEGSYHDGINKGIPSTFLFEESEEERNGGGAEKDNDELVLELVQDEFPEGRRRFLRDC